MTPCSASERGAIMRAAACTRSVGDVKRVLCLSELAETRLTAFAIIIWNGRPVRCPDSLHVRGDTASDKTGRRGFFSACQGELIQSLNLSLLRYRVEPGTCDDGTCAAAKHTVRPWHE